MLPALQRAHEATRRELLFRSTVSDSPVGCWRLIRSGESVTCRYLKCFFVNKPPDRLGSLWEGSLMCNLKVTD